MQKLIQARHTSSLSCLCNKHSLLHWPLSCTILHHLRGKCTSRRTLRPLTTACNVTPVTSAPSRDTCDSDTVSGIYLVHSSSADTLDRVGLSINTRTLASSLARLLDFANSRLTKRAKACNKYKLPSVWLVWASNKQLLPRAIKGCCASNTLEVRLFSGHCALDRQ